MRRVACYAAESPVTGPDGFFASLQSLIPIVEIWLKTKGAESLKPGLTDFTLRDGRAAIVHAQRYSTLTAAEWDISVDEPTSAGRFLTRIVLGGSDRTLHLFVELRAGVGGYRLEPHEVDVRCPLVLRELLLQRTWSVGKTPISIKSIRWVGEGGAKRFLAVMEHEERNLPIIVVSEFNASPLSPNLPEDIARDLSGLAIVAHLDEAASWAVTMLRGKEWSCFDGAIRVYWPMQRSSKRAYDHPLWTRKRLVDSTGSEIAAGLAIRNEIRRRLLELSTYAVDEPAVLGRIRDDTNRQKFEEMRQAADSKGEQGALAEEYFNECVRLGAELESRNERIGLLQDQVRSLSQVWNFASKGVPPDLPPETECRAETIAEAVDRAKRKFPDELFLAVT